MYSRLLKDNGLVNFIGGSDYNFRAATNSAEQLVKDYKRLIKAASITQPVELYTGSQTHSTNVAYADGTSGESFLIGRQYNDTDGLVTDKKNVALVIKFADCTPIVLYDPVKKVQAIVHSGWRGTVGEISKVALLKMTNEYGVEIKNVIAYVGPSIGQENYEVGPEVYEAFLNNPDRDQFFKPQGEKYLLDMSLANVLLLHQAGISKANIEVEKATTYTDTRLHSARQEGKDYGLNAMITCFVQ